MKIQNFVPKGLQREGNAKGVPPDTVDKLRKMFAFLDNMDDPGELRALTPWKPHSLTGVTTGATKSCP